MTPAEFAPAPLRAIAPYQPGPTRADLVREFGLAPEKLVDLSANENPLGMSPLARAALDQVLVSLNRYPDGNGSELKAAICRHFAVASDQIVLGNGSNDLLELVARALLGPGRSAVYSQYCFAVYPLVVRATGAYAIETRAADYGHDLDAMLAAIRADTRVVFIANPNNPTGTLCRPGDVVEFLERCPPEVLVVLDEAYCEFLPKERRVDSLALLRRFPNLLLVRTLSKAYGLAGLRVGFALGSPEMAELLNRIRQPFNVNSLALAAATAALDDRDFVAATVRNNTVGLAQIGGALLGLGLPFIRGYANFLTFHVGDGALLNRFLLARGILLRPLAAYGLPDSLRVSIGLPEENTRFIEAMSEAFE